ncbi:MAG: dienelactone hydrolase family protein [Bacteroidia bacterium]|nr:dienelactone hydrolase family protein [Bacteroidia bacterium]
MVTKSARKMVFISRCLVCIAIFAIWIIGSVAYGAEVVSFKGTTKIASGDFVTLTGKLTKPQGDGPFPAVVMLHGCRGFAPYTEDWAERLASWGYVALQVDSLGPRGEKNICDKLLRVPYNIRTQDAYDAKSYLSGLPFVDPNRMALMGWSHGGISTLTSVSKSNYATFAADVTTNLEPPKGELDDWCPAALCQKKMPSGKTANEVILKIYPGAYHVFDWKGIDLVVLGHRMLYNPAALADSIVQVKEFLTKQLK